MAHRTERPLASVASALVWLVACSGSHTNPPPPPAPGTTSTGAFAVVTVAGTRKLYLPMPDVNDAGHGWISVVDLDVAGSGTAGAPAQLAEIDLGTADTATTVGASSTAVVAASGPFPDVWLIDPTADRLVQSLALDSNTGRSSFSGAFDFVTGVAVDPVTDQAILSVWNGFQFVDLDAGQLTSVIPAPPSENFALDSAGQRVYAPYYDCALAMSLGQPPSFCGNYPTDGLNVVDLQTAAVSTYVDPFPPAPGLAVGGEPDSAAFDPNSQSVVVPAEEGGFENVLSFASATYDAGTVAAPHHYVDGLGFTGVSIEPTGTYVFLSDEFSNEVAVFTLAGAISGADTYGAGTLPPAPGSAAAWSNIGDPHGVAAAQLANGTLVGVVVDTTFTWLARVDLKALSTAPVVDGGIAPSDVAAAVTFLNARSPK